MGAETTFITPPTEQRQSATRGVNLWEFLLQDSFSCWKKKRAVCVRKSHIPGALSQTLRLTLTYPAGSVPPSFPSASSLSLSLCTHLSFLHPFFTFYHLPLASIFLPVCGLFSSFLILHHHLSRLLKSPLCISLFSLLHGCIPPTLLCSDLFLPIFF